MRIYEELITKSKHRTISEGVYTEDHHVIPKCTGGSDDECNLVTLTAREHFIAHMLLYKIFKNSPDGYKLLYAVNLMRNGNSHDPIRNSREFHWSREAFSKYHPSKYRSVDQHRQSYKKGLATSVEKHGAVTKRCACGCGGEFIVSSVSGQRFISGHNPAVARKKELKESDVEKVSRKCACGCGGEFICRPESNWKFIRGHSLKKERKPKAAVVLETRLCACGCGGEFTVSAKSKQKYKDDHYNTNRPPVHVSEDTKLKLSTKLKRYCGGLGEEQLSARMANSARKCDHAVRGINISKSKKGKKTNQKLNEMATYGKMTDMEFEEYIKERTPSVKQRMINRRNEYRAAHNISG